MRKSRKELRCGQKNWDRAEKSGTGPENWDMAGNWVRVGRLRQGRKAQRHAGRPEQGRKAQIGQKGVGLGQDRETRTGRKISDRAGKLGQGRKADTGQKG